MTKEKIKELTNEREGVWTRVLRQEELPGGGYVTMYLLWGEMGPDGNDDLYFVIGISDGEYEYIDHVLYWELLGSFLEPAVKMFYFKDRFEKKWSEIVKEVLE